MPGIQIVSLLVYPASDSTNKRNWKLNKAINDEFENNKIDTAKWLVPGTNGVYQSNWIGRAPSQFSTENVRMENGKLVLQTRWEPGFNFSKRKDRMEKLMKI